MPSKHQRWSPAERREAILASARRLFAVKGLEGTSTRDLARAAGVTQPLFYHYFPSKEALYRAMLKSVGDTALLEAQPVLSRPPSTATLIALVEMMVAWQVSGRSPERDILLRHLFQSLIADGHFAKEAFCSTITQTFNAKLKDCLQAAVRSGDMIDSPVALPLRIQLLRHVTFGLKLFSLPSVKIVDYGVSRDALVRQTTCFLLRGMGLQDSAITRFFKESQKKVPSPTGRRWAKPR